MNLSDKLKKLPSVPGVYFHKNKAGEIIYVGKAAVLKNRVRQYFQKSKNFDIKTRALISEISDVEWLETESEIDALFLEAEMVKRYMPRYNILLRDDKSLIFIRIDMKSEYPTVGFTRNPSDDGAEYFGPYYNGFAIKKALRYLRRVFPYFIKSTSSGSKKIENDLDSHLGLSPVGMTSSEYKANLHRLISYLKGGRKKLITELEKDMKKAADQHDFERAAIIRNRLRNIYELRRRIMFGDREFLDISKDVALSDLTELLNLDAIPNRIEGYDISHTGGTNVVASMVVFTNGASDRAEYRKFKTHTDKNDDFYNMNEIITRRFSPKNIKAWGRPNLVLIDGGKGQLEASLGARAACDQSSIPFIGLAKKLEQIVVKDIDVNKMKLSELGGTIDSSDDFIVINLPNSAHVIKLLQRIRDESHRFAVSYHTSLRSKQQSKNVLEQIPGIGPKTRSKLIRKFGSMRAVKAASGIDIIELIGKSKANLVIDYIKDV